MKFELEKFHRNTNDKDLLEDLKRAYHLLKKKGMPLTFRSYNEIGNYSSATMKARFGSWNNALAKAQIEINEEKNISDKDLFLNLEKLWTSLGRQPVTRDLAKPLSKYTHQTYSERFGSWRKALEAFVDYINEDEANLEIYDEPELEKDASEVFRKRRTNRNLSDRMRFRILSRDGFTCHGK